MTIFGSRDFAPVAEGAVGPRAESGWSAKPQPEPPTPAATVLPFTLDTRRIVIRVNGGEEIEVGRTEGREPAVRVARDTIRMIEDAQQDETWPEIGDRFLRPGAIVSVDVQRTDGACVARA